MANVQEAYQRVSRCFGAAARTASPDKWSAQSPCTQWTPRDVVAHIVNGHRGVIAGVRGGEPRPMGADEDPLQAWTEAQQELEKITADPDALAQEVDGPPGKMPAGELIGRFVTMDLLVHTWDLARAVGG
ncbi:MAG TPA: maleylpyruvate isomerase family mycothiol-dependent enzyme, partial [Mycobacteriales bacterium]|nr:maleylpyruvate isomerase family mycothiol-dependent enzyme [Mycobacteriales bacterium]